MTQQKNKLMISDQPLSKNHLIETDSIKPDAALMHFMKLQIEAANPINSNELHQILGNSLESLAPRDNVEAMLITQMISTHNVIMMLSVGVASEVRSYISDRYPRANILAKLINAYTRQMEALTGYRGKQTNQKITVEQVTVESGGQAIVGNVKAGASKDG